MVKFLGKTLRFIGKIFLQILFPGDTEVSPEVYHRGGHLYENTNKPSGPPPLKLKKSKPHYDEK